MKLVPQYCSQILRRFGQNLLGQSNFRVVWSEDRMEWRNGAEEKKYGDGANCWVLEAYCGPEKYGSRETWEAAAEYLGPFPSLGDYEEVYRFKENDVHALPLLPTTLELYCHLIEKSRGTTRSMRWKAIQDQKELAKQKEKQRFDDLWDKWKPAVHAKIPQHIVDMCEGKKGVITAEEVQKILGKKTGPSQMSINPVIEEN